MSEADYEMIVEQAVITEHALEKLELDKWGYKVGDEVRCTWIEYYEQETYIDDAGNEQERRKVSAVTNKQIIDVTGKQMNSLAVNNFVVDRSGKGKNLLIAT